MNLRCFRQTKLRIVWISINWNIAYSVVGRELKANVILQAYDYVALLQLLTFNLDYQAVK